jgi:hypothetical protein
MRGRQAFTPAPSAGSATVFAFFVAQTLNAFTYVAWSRAIGGVDVARTSSPRMPIFPW